MMMECGTGPSSGSGGVTSGGAPVMGGDDDDVMAEGDGGLPPLLQVPLGMPKFFDLATYAPRTHRLDEVAMRQWEPMGVFSEPGGHHLGNDKGNTLVDGVMVDILILQTCSRELFLSPDVLQLPREWGEEALDLIMDLRELVRQ
ncbi:hypothetical protein U1Q18_014236 [Sarracenia purpurea var. burkii]